MSSTPVDARLISVQADTPAWLRAYAQEKIAAALAHTSRPVLAARVRLVHAASLAPPDRAYARVRVDVGGHLLRAEARATTMREAIDILQQRLRRRLKALARKEDGRCAIAARLVDEVEDGAAPTVGGAPLLRPDARIVERNAFVPTRLSAVDAAAELDLLDYRFLVFRDVDTGVDSVVFRTVDGGYGLEQAGSASGDTHDASDDISPGTTPTSVPVLDLAEAAEWLRTTGVPHLLFHRSGTERAAVVYVRSNGDIGLVTAAQDVLTGD